MNITNLIQTAQKPKIYSPGTAVMWTDEYISTQLLETHLNANIDLASRKPAAINSTLEWIESKIGTSTLDILDLGCGPGLYSEKLAKQGHRVTGIDFSTNSIEYARRSAQQHDLDITYINQDYLKLNEEGCYDLIIMIFCDFGVLNPEQQETLLLNINRALKPGGQFIFDVLNSNYAQSSAGEKDWQVAEKGFWRETPYLALSESFYYEEQGVTLNQHTVVDQSGKTEVYRFWQHTFAETHLKNTLTRLGFIDPECYEKVLRDSEMYRSGDVSFYIARKK